MDRKKIAATLLLSSVPLTAFADFPDVPSNHSNAEAIHYVQSENIVAGYPDGTFRPNNLINRAEFVKILMESQEGLNYLPTGKCFTDVGNDWFAPYICHAKQDGIVAGYPDGSFRPADNINFVEAAKIIAIANGSIGPQEPLEGTPWYKTYVEDLDTAVPESIQSFDQQITRGEMAEMIYRIRANITTKPSITYDQLWEKYSTDSMLVTIFLAKYNDSGVCADGSTGCYHIYVPIKTYAPKSNAVLKTSIEALLTFPSGEYGRYEHEGQLGTETLIDSFYLTDLHVVSATIVDGVAHINIEGQMASGGIGDDERMIGQLNATVMQFPSVKSADIKINGDPLRCIGDESGLPHGQRPCDLL